MGGFFVGGKEKISELVLRRSRRESAHSGAEQPPAREAVASRGIFARRALTILLQFDLFGECFFSHDTPHLVDIR